MTDTAIEFQFEGEGAKDTAWEFAELLESRAGLSLTVQHRPSGSDPPARGTIVEILSLVLTVPSAIMSVEQLITWIKKKRRPADAEAKIGRRVRISLRVHDLDETMNEEDMKDLLVLLEQAAGRGDLKSEERRGSP